MLSYRQSRRGHTKCDTRISKNIHHKRFMRVWCAFFFYFLSSFSIIVRTKNKRSRVKLDCVFGFFFPRANFKGKFSLDAIPFRNFFFCFTFGKEKKNISYVCRADTKLLRGHYCLSAPFAVINALWVCKSSFRMMEIGFKPKMVFMVCRVFWIFFWLFNYFHYICRSHLVNAFSAGQLSCSKLTAGPQFHLFYSFITVMLCIVPFAMGFANECVCANAHRIRR